MKNRLLSLLTIMALSLSLITLPAFSEETPLALLPDEPAPIVIEKDVPEPESQLTERPDLLSVPAQPLSLDGLTLKVEKVGGIAMMSAEGENTAPSNAVLIENSQNGQTAAQMYCTLDRQNNTASLVYAPEETAGMVVVPRTFTADKVEYTVTSVGYQAFAGCTGLTQVWLPDTVSSIGYEAFMDCDHLKAVGTYDEQGNSDPYALPEKVSFIDVRTFRGCTRLNSITIPAAVTHVSAWAFAYCYSLGRDYKDSTGVTYGVYFAEGSRLDTIDQGAFYHCISLENITLPQGLRSISLHAFYNCASQDSNGTLYGLKKLVIPSSVTEIGEQAFAYCGALKEVTIPSGVKTLPPKAFYSCSALEKVDFAGDGLTGMGHSAFYWCTSLKTIRTAGAPGLPESLRSIPQWCFYRCDSLADLDLSGVTSLRTIEPYAFNESGVVTLTLPQNLKTIGMLAFEGCGKLKTINWNRPENDDELLEVNEKAFAKTGLTQVTVPQLYRGTGHGLEMFYDCDSLTRVDCAPNARFIPDGAFRDCDNLTTVTLGKNIDAVGQQAFYSCPKLSGVDLDNALSLATIGHLAFCRTALTTVSLPASIQDIGLNAFGINRSLISIQVADGNPGGYYSIDGVLYQSDGSNTLLVRYPAGKEETAFAVPDGVTMIDTYAFSHSEKLVEVTFPDSLRVIGSYAFSHCIDLETADVPESVTQRTEIFEGSYHMTSVTLPPDITEIVVGTIPANSKVTSVTLPVSASSIDNQGPFSLLPLLEEIKVEAKNPNFTSVDGVLFSKDMKTLYAYPRAKEGKEYKVPDGVTTIWYSAFSGAANLEHIVFPASVTTVRLSACHNMPNLERLDIYREMPTVDRNPNGTMAYNGFLSETSTALQVYVCGDPTDKTGVTGWINNFDKCCVGDNSVKKQNIHVDFFKSVAAAGDRFVENGVIYTLISPTAKTVKVGDNIHYEGAQVTVPAQVTHDGVTYTVTAVESGAFAGASLTAATVMLPTAQIAGDAFDSGVTLLTRSDLSALTADRTTLTYGDVLTVNTPAGVKENESITLTANGKSLSASVKGGVALFPADKTMVDAFGFGSVTVSASGGEAKGEFALTLSPKTLTINDLNSSLGEFRIEKPYDGTSRLDHTEKAALESFTVTGDDLALHVTGTLPVDWGVTLHGNGDRDTQLSLELTGTSAKYYRIGDDVLSKVRIQVTKGQLYIKETGGVLQQPTFHRVWAAEDGLRLKDCNLNGGSFIAYLPTVENDKITGYTQVDVKGYIEYTDENHYPGLASFDEIGVQQDQVYHWAFVPSGNGELQDTLSNYTFCGTVKPWDTSLTKGKDPDQGKTGENPALPSYVLQAQADDTPARPIDSLGAAASTPTSTPTTPSVPSGSGGGSSGSGTSSGGSSSPSGSGSPSGGGSLSGGGSPSGGGSKATVTSPATASEEPPIVAAVTTTPVSRLFHDVPSNSWYCNAIQYVCDKGMMNGMGKDSFAPDAVTTRGTIVTMLYRLEKEPSVPSPTFHDVSENLWYAHGVSWAASTGLVNGFEDGAFRPESPITREQVVTILYRYAVKKGYDVSVRADLSRYSDAAQVSPYAVTALSWATASGLIQGQDWGGLDPAGSTTRAQLATILMRFCETMMK